MITIYRTLGLLLALAMLVVACGPGAQQGTPGATPEGTPAGTPDGTPAGTPEGTPAGTPDGTPAGTPTGEGNYHIGVSNTIAGNGWREEMICSIRAQARVSGEVGQLTVAHRNTDAQGQLQDIRTLISSGVDAIIVNPASPDALNPALQEAVDQGIVVVAVDQAVTLEDAYLMANNQEEYGYLGAKWLFEHLGGEGDVVYMRGAAGAPADEDRHRGWQRALDENPNIKVVLEQHTGWDQTQAVQIINDFLATGQNFDGIWTSGVDNVIVDQLRAQGAPFVPVVGADNAGFVAQLIDLRDEGLEGAAVTNPAAVGGAGVTLALQILNGQEPENRQVLVNPELWENVTEEGLSQLQGAADPDLDPTWPLGIQVEGWTTYSKDDIIDCRGPGE